ncbi:MAG: FHA domain-containing protein [Clostridia bacterium]|nr:FHA domain-containing protein [Clostridia bacterium]
MNNAVFSAISTTARHVFWVLMLLIVLRAIRITLVDARRATQLRVLSPMTGLSGELVVMEGDRRMPVGTRFTVIREGLIGASRYADIRLRHPAVSRRHAVFHLTERGLEVSMQGKAVINTDGRRHVHEAVIKDGGTIAIGPIRMMLILTEATAMQQLSRMRTDEPDPLFDVLTAVGEDRRRRDVFHREQIRHEPLEWDVPTNLFGDDDE